MLSHGEEYLEKLLLYNLQTHFSTLQRSKTCLSHRVFKDELEIAPVVYYGEASRTNK